jgi:hypothetical protein
MSLLGTSALAEEASGKFTLTHEVHWGLVVLAPGDYTYKLEHHSSEMLLVRSVNGKPGFMMMANSVSSMPPGEPDCLKLQKKGDTWFVSSISLSGLEEELHFSTELPRSELARLANQTKLASLSKP